MFRLEWEDPIDPQHVAWCAAFANAILRRENKETTHSLMARSFLHWGKVTHDPKEGDIVVLARGKDGWSGHVGFFMGYETFDGVKYVKVLGGNTDNYLEGNLGIDLISGGNGNDTINGGDGADICSYNLSRSDYFITLLDDGYKVQAIHGLEGIDYISNVESFKFSDQTILASDLDFIAPLVVSLNPLDESINFLPKNNISINFNEDFVSNLRKNMATYFSPYPTDIEFYNTVTPENFIKHIHLQAKSN